MLNIEFFLGLVGSILVTVSYVPQVVKTIRRKSTKDLSLYWLVILTIGLAMYTVYGISIDSLPVIISSAVGGLLVVILLTYKIKYK